MITALVTILVLVNLWVAYVDPAKGGALFAILVLISPHAQLSGSAISFELLASLPILVVLIHRHRVRIQPIEHGLLGLYLVVITFATILSVPGPLGGVVWVRAIAIFRFVLLVVVLSQVLEKRHVLAVVGVVIAVNCLAASVQLIVPSSVDVFSDLYSKASQTVLERYREGGYISRATGTMNSPVTLGAFCVVAFAIAISELRYGLSAMVIAVLAVITGLMSLSKTAVLGIPIIGACAIGIVGIKGFFRLVDGQVRLRVMPAVVLLSGLIGTIVISQWLINFLDRRGFFILYYLETIRDPLVAFATRYDRHDGFLVETMGVVREHWVIGVGFTTIKGEFVGDSIYVSILHDAGVIGLAIFAFLFIRVSVDIVSSREYMSLLPLVALTIVGAATPALFSMIGVIVISFSILSCQKRSENRLRSRSFLISSAWS